MEIESTKISGRDLKRHSSGKARWVNIETREGCVRAGNVHWSSWNDNRGNGRRSFKVVKREFMIGDVSRPAVNCFITASKGTFTKIGHARNIIAHRNALISCHSIFHTFSYYRCLSFCVGKFIFTLCVYIYMYMYIIYIYGRCVFSNVCSGRKWIFVHCNYPCCDIDYETIYACSTVEFK